MTAHLTVLGIWFVLWLVFNGWGLVACRISRCDRDDAVSLLLNPWIGMSLIIGILQIWHLFAPVNIWACWVVCVTGIFASILGYRRLSLIWVAARAWPLLATLTGLCVLWFANRSLHPQTYVDHGSYYLNAIRWNSDYAIVPGLANLHNRLAFNNSIFLLHALVEYIIGRGYSAHVVNGLMAALAIPIIFYGFRCAFYGTKEMRQAGWFMLAVAMIVAIAICDYRIFSATPDFPAGLFVTIAVWRLLVVSAVESESQGVLLRWNVLTIAILAAAAVTIKTSALFLVGLAGIPLVAIVYRLLKNRSERPLLATARLVAFAAVWAALLFVPWILRGYVLSGYPLFPASVGGAPVDWKYNPQTAADLRELMRLWYRTIHIERGYLPGWHWIPEWLFEIAFLRAPIETVLPALIALASMFWLGWCAWTRRPNTPNESQPSTSPESDSLVQIAMWLMLAAYIGAIALWFFTLPSPRLGVFAMWGFAALTVALVSRTISWEWTTRHRRLIRAILILLIISPMIERAVRFEIRFRNKPEMADVFGHHFYEYYPLELSAFRVGFPPVPKGNLEERTTNSGLVVYLGKMTPKGIPDLVWDSPLPATQFFDLNLSLRRPGDMSSGFKPVPFRKGWDTWWDFQQEATSQ